MRSTVGISGFQAGEDVKEKPRMVRGSARLPGLLSR